MFIFLIDPHIVLQHPRRSKHCEQKLSDLSKYEDEMPVCSSISNSRSQDGQNLFTTFFRRGIVNGIKTIPLGDLLPQGEDRIVVVKSDMLVVLVIKRREDF